MTIVNRVLNWLFFDNRASESSHEAEEKYSNLFNNSNDAIITTDMEMTVTSWNRSAEKIFEWKAEEVIGKNLNELIVPPSLHAEEEKLVHDVLSEKIVTGFNTIRFNKGWINRISVSLTLFPLLNTDKKKIGLMYLFKDQTERKEAETTIKEHEKRFQSVMQSSTDAIILSDSIGNIISLNKGAEKIFQYSKEEILGKQISILVPKRYKFSHENKLKRMTSTGEAHIIGKKIALYGVRKDGNEFPIELSLSFWNSGKITFYSGIIRDVTERKKAEKIQAENIRLSRLNEINRDTSFLKERKKIEEVQRENTRFTLENKAESEFISNISHELRTPLNSIIGFSDLLKQKIGGDLSKKQEQYIDNIISSGKYLLDFINDIDLKMVEAGKVQLFIEKIRVGETINESVNLIKEQTIKQKINLQKNIDSNLDFIEADRKRFKQIMFGLLANAVTFNSKDGIIVIAAKKTGDMAEFSVSYTGAGIKEEDMDSLFTKSKVIDTRDTEKKSMSGFGLVIIKKLVEMHGGTIAAESKYGEGSTFTFKLPVAAKNK